MKRSEMIKILQDAIYMNTEEDVVVPEVDVSIILRTLEDAGMSPPFVESIWIAHAQTSNPVSGHAWEDE